MQLDISPPFVSCSPPPLKKICLLVVAKLDVSSFVLFPQASSGLIYYGLGRMLSYISPAVIAGANLSNCNFAMVLDKVGQSTPRDVFFLDAGAFSSQQGAHYCSPRIYVLQANNIPASERQKYIDNRKATAARDLESSVAASALLSLRGTKSIVMNTAYATVDANHAVMEGVLEGLKQGLTIGAAHLKSVRELQCELEYMKYNAVLYGLPFMRDAAAK